MPPRLSHKKTRTGCQRCKARKVKCDEGRPGCGACSRHNVPCEYGRAPSPGHSNNAFPPPPQEPATSPGSRSANVDATTVALEVRLMHEWDVFASKSFTTGYEHWQCQVADTAMECRYLTDCVLAIGAFHAARRPASMWVPTAGRMVPASELMAETPDLEQVIPNTWHLSDQAMEGYRKVLLDRATKVMRTGAHDRQAMLNASHDYFDRAVEGHRRALVDLNADTLEGAYFASTLIGFLALCNLSDRIEETEPALWLQLGAATRQIVQEWRRTVGEGWAAFSGMHYGAPTMTDEAELFNPEHATIFGHLLTHGREYENLSDEDLKVYQESLSYVGLMYKSIVSGDDTPQMTCRRLTAMPARLHPRFTELVTQGQPRAMAMLAHVFACMKLLDGRSVWFLGIAEVQIPRILNSLPPAWTMTIDWPVAIAEGRFIEPGLGSQSIVHMSKSTG